MPSNVASASASVVMPQNLCASFQRSQKWRGWRNTYANGELEASSLVTNDRRAWDLSPKVTPAQLAALRDFWLGQNGSQKSFFFYDLFDAGFVYDPTGAATTGRYICRFEGNIQWTVGLGRLVATIALVEIL